MASVGGRIHRWLVKFWVIAIWLPILVSCKSLTASKPHIIFMLADDLGWYDVSWHNPKAITPNLESLANDGILLEQSYVQPTCTPTRSALLTGRYPFTIGRQHGVLGSTMPTGLLLNATLLPQALKSQGYETHAVGKWHLGFCDWDYTPTFRGFDTFYGYFNGGETHYSKIAGQGIVGYDFRNNTEPDFSVNGTYDTDVYSTYVENLLKSRNPEDPMFLYLAFQSVHNPLEVPEMYREPFQDIGDEDREILLGMSWAMDDAVGVVVDALKATGHYDNSIIIFSSDNGAPVPYGINWPLRGSKGTLWEGGTRVPGLIHSPLLPNKGIVSNTLMHITDWYSTLVGLAGGIAPEVTDGFDQWEALTTGAESPRTSMVYNIDKVTLEDNSTQINAAIRKGEYKLILGYPGDGSWTLPPEGIMSFNDLRRSALEDLKVIPMDKDKEEEEVLNGLQIPMVIVNDDAPINRLECISDENAKIQLYNVIADPEERTNIAEEYPEVIDDLLKDFESELLRLVPADFPPNDPSGDPKHYDGVWTPGWC